MREQRSGTDRRAAEPVDPWYEGLNEADRADYDKYCAEMEAEYNKAPEAPDYDSRGEEHGWEDDRRKGVERRGTIPASGYEQA